MQYLRRSRTEAKAALWMLPVFAFWTIAFIGLSAPVARLFGVETTGGEVPYIENWFGWTAITLLWVVPLVIGAALAWDALHRDRTQPLARTALIINAVVLVALVAPSLLDRLINLG
jgi:hypothetical protein